jgi:predicted transcriptional regulator
MSTPAQIRAARALLGWTQAELAAKADISTNALVAIERGKADPKLSTVNAIRRALEAGGAEFTDDGRPGVRMREPSAA